jgi:predicted DNA-binding transcriptional regulator YafY
MVYRPTARVLSVLEMLQANGHMSGNELAERLGVDVRTVRRYINTLQDMGIPVEAEIGRYGGYALRPGYKLPPLMFNDDEVLVLVLGLRMARNSGLVEAGLAVESALAKIERVLPFELRQRLRALQETLWLDAAVDEILVEAEVVSMLSLASQQRRQVRLVYASPNETTERVFDPYSVIHHNDNWYAVGYCHLRRAQRTFRLDRVESVAVLDTTFTPPPDFDALGYMLDSFQAIPDTWDIEVLLDMPLDEVRRRIPRAIAALEPEGERVRLRSSMPNLDEFARTLLMLGCSLTIIQPPELRTAFENLAQEINRMVERGSAQNRA